MQQISIKQINMLNLAKIWGIFCILSLFAPIRYVFYSRNSYITGLYSDFTTQSLYLADIFIILTAIFTIIPRGKKFIEALFPIRYLILWVFMVFFWHIKDNFLYSLWFFVRILEMFVAYGTLKVLWGEVSDKIKPLYWFIGLSTLESGLSLYQFFLQRPLGLYKLGETHLNAGEMGIAKIIVNNQQFIRGYGTFPHPNLLGCFLATSLILIIWPYTQNKHEKYSKILTWAFIVNFLGLISTFSRSACIALFFGIIIIAVLRYRNKIKLYNIRSLSLTIFAAIFSGFLLFQPFIVSRKISSDAAITQRIEYNNIAERIIKQNFITGLGFGQSVLHMNQFSDKKLWPWDIQPIHNYFLLAATEGGALFSLLLLLVFINHLLQSYKNRNFTEWFPSVICIMFLVLMMTDHYFYTLPQTMILLWLTLAIVPHETKNLSTQ